MRSTVIALVLAAGALAGAVEKPPTLRLDRRARPTGYAVRLAIDPAQPMFTGVVDIELTLERATDTVWLDGTALTVKKAEFTVGGARLPARVLPGGEDFIGFAVDRPLPAGAVELHVEYKGAVSRKDDRGIFAEREGGRWYAVTQFEAIFARRAFPCFDEPDVKVPWRLTLEVPKSLVAVSNTAITSEHPGPGASKTIEFAQTAPLPSYLVAFAVGPYEIIDAGHAGQKQTALRVFAPAGRGADARYAASVSGPLLDLLERYFAIPFPFGKLDNVSIPLTTEFGAMENAGMVTFALNLIVAKPTNQSIRFQRDYAETAAHEYAHQWFGDLVTTAWWDDIWLNESFASWMEAKIIGEYKPDWSHGTEAIEARSEALAEDALTTARQVRQPIVSDDDIYNVFDDITYQKGQTVLGMFERFVGVERFRAGIREYLRAHADGNATADDFIAAIARAATRPELAPAFKSFLDQSGAPLVDVALQCAPGKPPVLSVKQQRFLPLGSKGSPGRTWQIPMCVRWLGPRDGGAAPAPERTCALVTRREQTIALGRVAGCPGWLLANDGELGYYRTAYPPALLQKLFSADGRTQLDRAETVGLVDDLRALVDAGRVPLGEALTLASPLVEDPRRQVQEALVDLVGSLDQHLVGDADRPRYVRFIGKLFGARAQKLGWTDKPGEDEDTRLLRPTLVALVADQGEDGALRKEARALAEKWLKDRKAVSPDVAQALLGVAARFGDRALFDEIHAEARRAADRRDRALLIGALGRFRDPALAKAALAIVGKNEFDPRETMEILKAQAAARETRALAWSFLRARWDMLVDKMPAETMAESPALVVGFCDEEHARELDDFFRARSPKLPGGPRDLAQAEESIALCRAYVAAQRPGVAELLARY